MNEMINHSGLIKAGFRIQYLEVLNWGTFNKNVWRVEPDGNNSLLTGDIGSGKSTLVDALTCLIVPYQKITFNKAAGADARERNLLTYVRGEFKKSKEEITKSGKPVYLRPDDSTYSVIVANFHNSGYNENVCLAQLFWLKDGKVERLFISSEEALTIKEHFSNFSDINELRKRLRRSESIEIFDTFSHYSENFRHRFGMTSDKAIDLFYQTVSMKSVSSLTEFVREQMLERTDVKEHIATLLKRFDDLIKAHEAVVNSRKQYEILKPLVEHSVEYGKTIDDIETIEEMLKVVPAWFAIQKQTLLQEAITTTDEELEIADQTLKALQEDLRGLEARQLGLAQDIDNNGGKRLEQIGDEIQRREQLKVSKKKDWDNYDSLAKQCGLSSAENEAVFFENIHEAKRLNESYLGKEIDLRDQRDQLVIDLKKKRTELTEEQSELTSLRERKTQIPGWLVSLRRQICVDLRIDEEELPFAAELLKVRDEEHEWEGAIERLLHDFGISLLVPRNHFKSVSKYINSTTMYSEGQGRKLTCLEANIENQDSYLKQMDSDSVLNKLEIKPETEFYTWIENYLHRNYSDCICVDIEELQHISYGITKQGLIKSGKIRHTKDDRRRINERRYYVLGWTNIEKIKALEETIGELESAIQVLQKSLDAVEESISANKQLKEAIAFLLHVKEFSSINWYYEMDKIYELEEERKELLENNDLLRTLKERLEEVKTAIEETKEREREKNQQIGGIKKQKEIYERQFAFCDEEILKVTEQLKQKHFAFIEERLKDKQFRLNSIDSQQDQFKKLFEGDSGELKKLRAKQTRLTTAITEKMRDIKDHSKAEYSELSTDIEARGEYIDKFHRLEREDLRRHEERFKEELNRNTIQGIAVFDSQLEKHEKEIKQKVHHINQHLREIVYDSSKNTYITIHIDNNKSDNRIALFKADLKACYMHSLSAGGELYNEAKYEQVKKILDRFASADPIDKDWTSAVTDVRQWFEFNASERYEADDTEKEFYEGSGGKSGGQKEKLAYTILASALAYQFGLQFGEDRSRSFRFVVIDEAFGRGSDESTRYGLELFKKLNLQLLIVTPLQKIHIIENHVNSFHFVSNRDGNNSQLSNFSLQEYREEKARRDNIFQSVSSEA